MRVRDTTSRFSNLPCEVVTRSRYGRPTRRSLRYRFAQLRTGFTRPFQNAAPKSIGKYPIVGLSQICQYTPPSPRDGQLKYGLAKCPPWVLAVSKRFTAKACDERD